MEILQARVEHLLRSVDSNKVAISSSNPAPLQRHPTLPQTTAPNDVAGNRLPRSPATSMTYPQAANGTQSSPDTPIASSSRPTWRPPPGYHSHQPTILGQSPTLSASSASRVATPVQQSPQPSLASRPPSRSSTLPSPNKTFTMFSNPMIIPSPVPPASAASVSVQTQTSVPVAVKAKPKPKSRKSANIDFLNSDLEWFAEQQKTGQLTSERSDSGHVAASTETTSINLQPTENVSASASLAASSTEATKPTVTADPRPDVKAQQVDVRVTEVTDSLSTSSKENATTSRPVPPDASDYSLGPSQTAPLPLPVTDPQPPILPLPEPHKSLSPQIPLSSVSPPAPAHQPPPPSPPHHNTFTREDSPDIPLALSSSPQDKPPPTSISLPTIATLPGTSDGPESEDDYDERPLAFSVIAAKLGRNMKNTSPKRKKGRPPGMRNVSAPDVSDAVHTGAPVTPLQNPSAVVETDQRDAHSSTAAASVQPTSASTSPLAKDNVAASPHKIITKKRKGRPPGIRAADVPVEPAPSISPTTTRTMTSPSSSSSLKIRLPPMSPEMKRKLSSQGPAPASLSVVASNEDVFMANPTPSNQAAAPLSLPISESQPAKEAQPADPSPEIIVDKTAPGVGSGENMDVVQDEISSDASALPRASFETTLPTSKDDRSNDASRKRALSEAARESGMPPQVKRKVDEEAAENLAPMPEGSISASQLTGDVAPPPTEMDIDRVAVVPESLVDVSLKPRSLLRAESREEGELTPSVATQGLPSPPSSHSAGLSRSESSEVSPFEGLPRTLSTMESGEITRGSTPEEPSRPPPDSNVTEHEEHAPSQGDQHPASEAGGPSSSSAQKLLADTPTLDSVSAKTSPTRLPRTGDPVYGSPMQIMGIGWGSGVPVISELKFMLKSDTIQLLTRWSMRAQLDGDMSDSRCISLATYPLEEVQEIFHRCGEVTPEELQKIRPLPWQDDLKLSMRANDGEEIWLCKPMYSYRDNGDYVVDITSRTGQANVLNFHEGQNSVKIRQPGGLQQYAWILVLHSPSPAQMRTLEAKRGQESWWKNLMTDLCNLHAPDIAVPALVDSLIGS
ncbi:hypothetical protein EIP91_009303 [Steccherinum ochraceum]|uniref:Uncharacterized protein n=1 Tax=Steccherinum ochraceum TaxID=92696 RepID=A0A4R0R1S8_9APHY|nr:hypothetical protein EIP91_009303 [Steccherinum ochraceum]